MAVLYIDLIEGNEATLTIDGWQFNRTAIVNKLAAYAGYRKLVEATILLQQEGAFIDAPHPAWPSAKCRSISPIAISNDTIKFSLIYKENSPLAVACNTALSQESTNIDRNKNPISLEYTYPSDYKDPNTGALSSLAGNTVKQGGTVMKYIPEISFSITRTETITGKALVKKQKDYVGKINSLAWGWIGDTEIQPAYTWLCTGIIGNSVDGGITFSVTYSFAYREDTWQPWIVFTRVDGNPATDAGTKESPTQPEAYKEVLLYKVVSFAPLEI